ncbi:drug/metabolite transporter (DMT)-like permease [Mesorhizobium sp. BE184]|nr:drug/metabolite transporter (DMT)-like permease [Mesorhizobium sp. BE184]
MSDGEGDAAQNTLTGIGMKIASVAIFVGMQACIKAADDVPPGQIVFFRSFFAIVPVLAFLAWRGELRFAFATSRPVSHVVRGLVGVAAMGFSFFALTRLPLPETITLNYAQPLLIVMFSAIFLGEIVRAYRWTAVAVGLFGVMVISWPNLTLLTGAEGIDNQQAAGVVAMLISAVISAVAALLVRKLVHTERTSTIVLWFSLTATIASFVSIPFGWNWLSPLQTVLLVAAGLSGGIAQILMTQAYRHAEASVVAPFEYTSMIFGLGLGYLLFADIPSLNTLIGGFIVIGAGLFIIWRERRLGLELTAARKAGSPPG